MGEGQEPESATTVRRYLTVDDIETWAGDNYRIRVWQGEFVSAVALVSQVTRGIHPRCAVTQVANYVQEAILHYPALGFSMFMDGDADRPSPVPQRTLEYVSFEFFGCRHRLRLFKPAAVPRDWKFLEELVGDKIDR